MAEQPYDQSRRLFLKKGSMLGLAVALSPWEAGQAFAALQGKENTMSSSSATQKVTVKETSNTSIRPFQVKLSAEDLADMHKRIKATRWPEPETVSDATQGVQYATMQKLARYWNTEHDWSKCEARLKALPHFVTEIDG